MDKKNVVGIADMKICRAPGVLVTYALGSCVGICIYDPVIRLAGLIHIMLPSMYANHADKNLLKYADTGIPEMLHKMTAFGGIKRRMTAKIAGGAKMFEITGSSIGNIGERNVKSVKEVLRAEGIRIVKEDTGGTHARTLFFDSGNGEVVVKSFGKNDLKL